MKYLLWMVVAIGVAFGEDTSHEQFDAPSASTLVAIGGGLVGLAALRRRRRQD